MLFWLKKCSKQRRIMKIGKFLSSIEKWAREDKNIRSVILVGSYARNEATPESDIDLCLLMKHPSHLIKNHKVLNRFGLINRTSQEDYGRLISLRVFYNHGLEVEYGLTDVHWVDTPLDDGTKKVLEDGYQVIIDKDQLFKNIHIGEWKHDV